MANALRQTTHRRLVTWTALKNAALNQGRLWERGQVPSALVGLVLRALAATTLNAPLVGKLGAWRLPNGAGWFEPEGAGHRVS